MLPRPHQIGLLCLLVLSGFLAACGAAGDTYFAEGSRRSEGALIRGGVEHGPWSYRYKDGQVRERGTWAYGHKEGTWTQWYATGQKHSEGVRHWDAELQASPREGPWTFWFSNGELRARGSFRAGLAEGTWLWWDHTGKLDASRSGDYAHGVRAGDLPDPAPEQAPPANESE